MLAVAPASATNVDAYAPLLDLLAGVLVTPQALGAHWGYTEEHLCGMRRAGRGPAFLKLPTGGIRYRAAEIIGSEIAGTDGPLTVDRVCLALAACSGLSLEARAAAQAHVRAAFR